MKFSEERLTKILAEAKKEEQIEALIQGLDRNEIRLIARCQSKDKTESVTAFNQIIARYQDGVFAYVSQRIQQSKQASRLARNIFVKAYKLLSKSTFHGEMALDEWLFALSKQHVDKRKKSFLSKGMESDDVRNILPAEIQAGEKKLSGKSECSHIRNLLPDYHEKELETPEAQQVKDHLEHCPRCQQEFQKLQHTLNQLLSHFDKIHAPKELREQINAIIDPEPFFALPSHQLVAIAASFVVTFVLAFLFVFPEIQNISETVKSNQKRLGEIDKTIQTLEQQGINRENLQSQTIVIGTGRLAAGTFSVEDTLLVSTHVAEPEKALFMTIPGGIEHLTARIQKKILAVQGDIKTLDVESFPEENFSMLTLEAEIPEIRNMPFSLLLLLDEPVQEEPESTGRILTITLMIFEKGN